MKEKNQWADRFNILHDPNKIRDLARVIPPPLFGLASLTPKTGRKLIERSLKKIFIPTDQSVSILMKLIDMAYAHSLITYPDNKTFISGVYAKECPVPETVMATCLTGLAGVGKSHIVEALRRILPPNACVLAEAHHPSFPLISAWYLKIREKTTTAKLLQSLLESDDNEFNDITGSMLYSALNLKTPPAAKDMSRLLRQCRRTAFKSGVSLTVADEFQFATRSENANTLVTSMLHHLSSLGHPLLYVANYSLCHRLLRRPQEDTQRLLSDPLILFPDSWDSSDWQSTVKAYCDVAPEVFRKEIVDNAKKVHGWTGGIKRLLGAMLVIAYERSRETGNGAVGLDELAWAYDSRAYKSNQKDVLEINKQDLTGEKSSDQLWCPFGVPKHVKAEAKERANEQYSADLGEAMIVAQLTESERKTYERLQNAARASSGNARSKVVPMHKRGKTSVDDLRRGEEAFRSGSNGRSDGNVE